MGTTSEHLGGYFSSEFLLEFHEISLKPKIIESRILPAAAAMGSSPSTSDIVICIE